MTGSLRFLGGTNTVGGVQVMVSGRTGRLVFDLGVVGNPAIVRQTTLFNPLLPPRPGSALLDYLRAGMAPLVENLYDAGQLSSSVAAVTERLRAKGFLLAGYPLITDTEPSNLAVFVSHLHEDHMMLLPFVSAQVPVLMSEPGARLHSALVRANALPATRAAVTGVAAERRRAVGDLTVEVLEVDHDVPGSAGVIIETPVGSVAYTGDWRLHGRHPDAMKAFAARCAGVDVLLTEASTATPAGFSSPVLPNLPERDVGEAADKLISAAGRGVYCSFHERNLERQAELRDIAAANGRALVLSARTHAIWQQAYQAGFTALDIGRHVMYWADEGAGDTAGAGGITAAEVAADPASFVCEMRRWDRPRLLDLAAGPGDVYLHLNGYPHGPADPGWPVLETWTKELGISFVPISSHGHALPADLQWLVEAVRPKVVVPVHTNAPESFPPVSVPVRAVRRGDQMSLSGRVEKQ